MITIGFGFNSQTEARSNSSGYKKRENQYIGEIEQSLKPKKLNAIEKLNKFK